MCGSDDDGAYCVNGFVSREPTGDKTFNCTSGRTVPGSDLVLDDHVNRRVRLHPRSLDLRLNVVVLSEAQPFRLR